MTKIKNVQYEIPVIFEGDYKRDGNGDFVYEFRDAIFLSWGKRIVQMGNTSMEETVAVIADTETGQCLMILPDRLKLNVDELKSDNKIK